VTHFSYGSPYGSVCIVTMLQAGCLRSPDGSVYIYIYSDYATDWMSQES